MTQYRQGDVFLMRVEAPDLSKHREVPRSNGGVVLALGEVTGHKHQFRERGVKLLTAEGLSDRIVSIEDGAATLVHEEHTAIEVPGGTYKARIQREYDPTTMSRAVED